jgi:anti-sigma B factor antagonist
MGRIAVQGTASLERPRVAVAAVGLAGGRFGDRVTVIRLSGEVDLFVSPELMEQVRGAIDLGSTRLLFDLTDATVIDSTTLGSIVSAQKRLGAKGGTVGVVCPSPLMAKIFSVTGLDRLFPVKQSLASLLEATALAGDALT